MEHAASDAKHATLVVMASGLTTGLTGSRGGGSGSGYQQSGPSSPQTARTALATVAGQTKGFGAVPALLRIGRDLIVQAKASGSGGEAITVARVIDGASEPLTVTVTSNAITVHLASDAGSNSISTEREVRNALRDTTASAALVSVALYPGEGDQIVAPASAANLAGDVNQGQGVASSAAPLPRQHPQSNRYN